MEVRVLHSEMLDVVTDSNLSNMIDVFKF